MQGPPPSQAAQQGTTQGQHHAALSQPAPAPDSAAVANTAADSAPSVATDSAPHVAADSAPPAAAEATTAMVAGSASGGGIEEAANEGTGHTPTVDSSFEGRLLLLGGHVGRGKSICFDTILFRLTGQLVGNLAAVDRHCT